MFNGLIKVLLLSVTLVSLQVQAMHQSRLSNAIDSGVATAKDAMITLGKEVIMPIAEGAVTVAVNGMSIPVELAAICINTTAKTALATVSAHEQYLAHKKFERLQSAGYAKGKTFKDWMEDASLREQFKAEKQIKEHYFLDEEFDQWRIKKNVESLANEKNPEVIAFILSKL